MKLKTSITLPQELVEQIDDLVGQYGNRSTLIERAIRDFLAAQTRRVRDAEDLAILNGNADDLNREASDVLSYQVDA
jgi:metal-responsive CopG/Arc/MetJ family transcriptional regulator